MTRRHGVGRVRAALLTIGVALGAAWPAVAQEFVKVEDGTREQLPATPFVGAAYAFIWVAVLAYVVLVARGLGRVQRDLTELRRRLERADPNAPPSNR